MEVVHWENFLDAMSETRLQDEYNQAIRNCDIFVALFFTKTGKFTEEEFNTAHQHFLEHKRPQIYTYFKDAPIHTGSIRKADLLSLFSFQEKLDSLGHFYTKYENPEHLKRHFRDQLDKLFPYSLSPGAAARVPRELPPAANQYFGRSELVKKLADRLPTHRETAVIGIAGMGKTALAAEALRQLPPTSFPDGIVYLDLYTLRASAEQAWDSMANKLGGPQFLEQRPAKERATAACQSRDSLVIIEGGEEATGQEGRTSIPELFSVLSPQNHSLLLTRLKTQSNPADSIELRDALEAADAAALFDSLTGGAVKDELRTQILDLLQGHPLALTWAGNLLARDDEDPHLLVSDWKKDPALNLNDPKKREHTLRWLMDRSVRGLDDLAQKALLAAGLLAHASFPVEAIAAGIGAAETETRRALKALVDASLLRRMGEENWQFTHILAYAFARREKDSPSKMREGLGKWLHASLATMLKDAADSAIVARSLEHLGALFMTDFDQQLWQPLAEDAQYDFDRRLTDIGRLGQVKVLLDALEAWFAGFDEKKKKECQWQREWAELLNRRGDVRLAQGDFTGALDAYHDSLAIRVRLADSDRSSTLYQRDLSVSYEKVGDGRGAQGDLIGALESHESSLEIAKRLAKTDPSNFEWQHDVSVSHDKIGVLHMEQSDLVGALKSYQNALDIRKRLAHEAPSDTRWLESLVMSHERIGDVRKAQGDLSAALRAYHESLGIWRNLTEADPANARWQRGISYTLNRLAEIEEAEDRPLEALRYAEESLNIREHLVALDGTNKMWQDSRRFSRALVERLRGKLAKGAAGSS